MLFTFCDPRNNNKLKISDELLNHPAINGIICSKITLHFKCMNMNGFSGKC